MSKKKRKIKEKSVSLQSPVTVAGPTFCGFPLKEKNINQLWRWDTLEDVNLN